MAILPPPDWLIARADFDLLRAWKALDDDFVWDDDAERLPLDSRTKSHSKAAVLALRQRVRAWIESRETFTTSDLVAVHNVSRNYAQALAREFGEIVLPGKENGNDRKLNVWRAKKGGCHTVRKT